MRNLEISPHRDNRGKKITRNSGTVYAVIVPLCLVTRPQLRQYTGLFAER